MWGELKADRVKFRKLLELTEQYKKVNRIKNSKPCARRPAIFSKKVNYDAVAIRFRYGALEALHSMMGHAYCPLGTLTSSVSTQKLPERWLQLVQRGVI